MHAVWIDIENECLMSTEIIELIRGIRISRPESDHVQKTGMLVLHSYKLGDPPSSILCISPVPPLLRKWWDPRVLRPVFIGMNKLKLEGDFLKLDEVWSQSWAIFSRNFDPSFGRAEGSIEYVTVGTLLRRAVSDMSLQHLGDRCYATRVGTAQSQPKQNLVGGFLQHVLCSNQWLYI